MKAPEDQIGISGGVASFVCQATGEPKPRITWMKKGKKVSSQRFEVMTKKTNPNAQSPQNKNVVITLMLTGLNYPKIIIATWTSPGHYDTEPRAGVVLLAWCWKHTHRASFRMVTETYRHWPEWQITVRDSSDFLFPLWKLIGHLHNLLSTVKFRSGMPKCCWKVFQVMATASPPINALGRGTAKLSWRVNWLPCEPKSERKDEGKSRYQKCFWKRAQFSSYFK